MKFRRHWLSLAVVVVLVVGAAAGVWLTARGSVPVVAEAGSGPAASEAPPQDVPVAPLAPEERAKQDLDRLVRDYYAAENEVYLDASKDPSAALDPYLRNPASGARVSDILTFRNHKHQLDSSTAEVHSVEVTLLDLAADPATAAIAECHTLAASGIDGETGEPASFSHRRRTVWTAIQLPDGSWRLKTYDTGEVGSC